jgi:hypothetical protein
VEVMERPTERLEEEGIVEVVVLDEVDPLAVLLARPLDKDIE